MSLIALSFVTAQDAIRYQGVAFDANDQPIVSSSISILFTIIEDDPTGSFSYIESHSNVATGADGEFEVAIGRGTPVAGTLADVDWLDHNHFLMVAVDPLGGTNYLNAGTTEFLSVPYAFYAPEALFGPRGVQGAQGPPGPQGPAGAQGPAGDPGQDATVSPTCWDTNNNGQGEPSEDINGDGVFNEADCLGIAGNKGQQGPTGPQGPQGPIGPAGDPNGPQGPIGEIGPEGRMGLSGGAPGPICLLYTSDAADE